MSLPAPLLPNQPPSTLEYGGDEISALVLDPGQAWTRAGFAGEDTPKSVIPSHYGVIGDGSEDRNIRKLFFGDNNVHTARPAMEVQNPMKDGIVVDWDVAPGLWRYALTSRLAQDLSEHPLLMTEPVWNPTKNREKTIEIAFEDFDVPAFYLSKSAVLAGFSTGKSTGLVIDAGAANIAVTPIHDGFVLKKGSVRSPIGGEFLSDQIRTYLASQNINLSAHYQVLSKIPVEVGRPAEAVLRNFPKGAAPTDSFHRFQEERMLTEFKECTAQVWTGPGPLPTAGTPGVGDGLHGSGGIGMNLGMGISGRPFEFPDGYNLLFGSERFRMTEGMFTPRAMLQSESSPDPDTTLGVSSLVSAAMRDVDVELKQHILNNIVVTGSTSLLYGFSERVNLELGNLFPGPRVRLTAPGNTAERRHSVWLGGSILASLGSFHQLWISKKEYEEHGANIVEKRCR